MIPGSIAGINNLPDIKKREVYTQLVPEAVLALFELERTLQDEIGRDLLELNGPAGTANVEIAVRHQVGFPDPILYGHLTDTLNGQLHILLYVINDPASPRFDVDRLPDGSPTEFGVLARNLEAERAAMDYGLAPGQIRRGLRMLSEGIAAFEAFVSKAGNEIYFIEPLYYHNAIIFERHGFNYLKGRRFMERIHAAFQSGGELAGRLDSSTAFRAPEAKNSVRLRSWAIHDGILGDPLTDVTMYKEVSQMAGVSTAPGVPW